MTTSERTAKGQVLTDLMLDLFRLNSRLLTAGDRLVSQLGLTSARWQILGTIVAAEHPQPVAWIARDLGAHRQNVQRITNDLEKCGLVAFEPNPHHKRANLVVLTDKGRETFDAAMSIQAPWANALAKNLNVQDLVTTKAVLETLQKNLEMEED